MKTLITTLMLLASTNVLALCYGLDPMEQSETSTIVPKEICLDKLFINPENESIYAHSSSAPHIFDGLYVTSLLPVDENYSFTASNLIYDSFSSQNGLRTKVTLTITGMVSFTGSSELDKLLISIREEIINRNDPANSYVKIYNYHLSSID